MSTPMNDLFIRIRHAPGIKALERLRLEARASDLDLVTAGDVDEALAARFAELGLEVLPEAVAV
jgi:hypothetical protein